MDIHFTFRHLEPTEALKVYAHKKLGEIEKYVYRPLGIHCCFTLDGSWHVVDLKVNVSRRLFKARGTSNNMYTAFDMALSALDKQLFRFKERMKHHKNPFKSRGYLLDQATNLFDTEHLAIERDSKVVKAAGLSRKKKEQKLKKAS